jgi:hypothetical protein
MSTATCFRGATTAPSSRRRLHTYLLEMPLVATRMRHGASFFNEINAAISKQYPYFNFAD